jgi:hypothetical protein
MAIKMVPFDELDWDMFAGAERGEDGTLPCLSSEDFPLAVDGEPVMYVNDNAGIEVIGTGMNAFTLSMHLPLPNIHLSSVVVAALPRDTTKEYLKALGFVDRSLSEMEKSK